MVNHEEHWRRKVARIGEEKEEKEIKGNRRRRKIKERRKNTRNGLAHNF